MSNTITELDLVVGSIVTVRPDEDQEEFEKQHEMVAQVQDQLREEGVVVDLLSQPGVEMWEGGIETLGSLYQLSRFAVHLEHNEDIAQIVTDGPILPVSDDDLDRAVTDVWNELKTTRFPNLVNLQGINSYYLPVDFPKPVWLPIETEEGEEDAAFFGSSVQLQRELVDLEEKLKQADVDTRSEAYRTLEVLHEAATASLQYGLPIIVW